MGASHWYLHHPMGDYNDSLLGKRSRQGEALSIQVAPALIV